MSLLLYFFLPFRYKEAYISHIEYGRVRNIHQDYCHNPKSCERKNLGKAWLRIGPQMAKTYAEWASYSENYSNKISLKRD